MKTNDLKYARLLMFIYNVRTKLAAGKFRPAKAMRLMAFARRFGNLEA
jgi:hypothetical protein